MIKDVPVLENRLKMLYEELPKGVLKNCMSNYVRKTNL